MIKSNHLYSMARQKPSFSSEHGTIVRVDSSEFPILKSLSIRSLTLASRAVREPHWHANAYELGYCLRGTHLVTIAADHSARTSFTISPGQMFFVPSGYLHAIENIGADEGEFILGFFAERVEDFGLSGTFGSFTDAVLGNTTGLPVSAFSALKRSSQDTYIGVRASAAVVEQQARHINPYKYDVETAQPPVVSVGGSAHTAQGSTWPILRDIAMYSLRVTDQGMREVHWHPDTAEMGYVTGGCGRMSIVSPGGIVDTYEMKTGDVYFIPRAYPHHIENIGSGDLSILIFFDSSQPKDIGGKSLVSAFSREVLAATFRVELKALPEFPFTSQDPLIVERINAVDVEE